MNLPAVQSGDTALVGKADRILAGWLAESPARPRQAGSSTATT